MDDVAESDLRVRGATPNDWTTVRAIVEGSMLELREGACPRRSTLVATVEGRIVGALVLDGNEIGAVAVRPNRRDQGIGSALVEAAASRRPRLEARFDPSLRPFYESLGFRIEAGRGVDGDDRGSAGEARGGSGDDVSAGDDVGNPGGGDGERPLWGVWERGSGPGS